MREVTMWKKKEGMGLGRRVLVTMAATAALVGVAASPALADSCANVSRPAPQGWTPATTYQAPLVQGGWVWLPSLTSVFGAGDFPPFFARAALYLATSRWNSASVAENACAPLPHGLTT